MANLRVLLDGMIGFCEASGSLTPKHILPSVEMFAGTDHSAPSSVELPK